MEGVRSLTPPQRLVLAEQLGKLPTGSPARRVWIPKASTTELRPLSMPTLSDRAVQALVKQALEPEWEAQCEPNSYGFRPGRSVHDAIGAIFTAVGKQPKYVLNADIARCFERIDQEALLQKTEASPTLQRLIRSWLKAEVVDHGVFTETAAGTGQGSVLTPLLANIALHGLEDHIRSHFPTKARLGPTGGRYAGRWKPQLIRYADNVLVLHRDKAVIQHCQRLVEEWLQDLGLELKREKPCRAHTLDPEGGKAGFDFLGLEIRQQPVSKYNAARGFKTLLKPRREAIKRHYAQLCSIIEQNQAARQETLIGLLNPVIRGWSNSYSAVVSKAVFQRLEDWR